MTSNSNEYSDNDCDRAHIENEILTLLTDGKGGNIQKMAEELGELDDVHLSQLLGHLKNPGFKTFDKLAGKEIIDKSTHVREIINFKEFDETKKRGQLIQEIIGAISENNGLMLLVFGLTGKFLSQEDLGEKFSQIQTPGLVEIARFINQLKSKNAI